MPSVGEVAGEKSASAADLEDQPVAFPDIGKELDDSWGAGIGVVPEPEMVDPR